jgi:hypothetical protein
MIFNGFTIPSAVMAFCRFSGFADAGNTAIENQMHTPYSKA